MRMVGVILAAGAAGWLLGRWWFPAGTVSISQVAAPGQATADPAESGGGSEERLASVMALGESSAQLATVAGWKDFGSVGEIRTALDQLEGREDSGVAALAKMVLLREWVRLGADGILGYASDHGGLFDTAALLWAEADPEAAVAALLLHPSPDWIQERALAAVVRQIGARDPLAALALVEDHHLGGKQIYRVVFEALATDGLTNAARLAAEVPDIAGQREAALSAVADVWARTDGAAAVDWLVGIDGGNEVMSVAFERWATTRPEEFLESFRDLPELTSFRGLPEIGGRRGYVAQRAAGLWWRRDPEAALAWLRDGVGDAEVAADLMAGIAVEAAFEDPAAAFELAVDLPASRTRQNVLTLVATSVCAIDPAGTAEWIGSLDDGDEREAAGRAAAGRLAESAPGALLENFAAYAPFLTNPKASHFGYTEIWRHLVPELLQDDVGKATRWLESLSPELHTDALQPLAESWAAVDPLAAADYLAGQPDSDDQVRATQEVVRLWAPYAPADAARWVASMEEGENKRYAAKNIVSHWTATDPVAVESWIAELPESRSREVALEEFEARGGRLQ